MKKYFLPICAALFAFGQFVNAAAVAKKVQDDPDFMPYAYGAGGFGLFCIILAVVMKIFKKPQQ